MPKEVRRLEKTRLTLDLPVKIRQRLEEMADETEAASLVEVVINSLKWYSELIKADCRGAKVVFRHKNGDEETIRLLSLSK